MIRMKRIGFVMLSALVALCLLWAFYPREGERVTGRRKVQYSLPVGEEPLSWELMKLEGNIHTLYLQFDTFQRSNPGKMTVEMYKNGEKAFSQNFNAANLKDHAYEALQVNPPISVTEQDTVRVSVTGRFRGDQYVALLTTGEDAAQMEGDYRLGVRGALGASCAVCWTVLGVAAIFVLWGAIRIDFGRFSLGKYAAFAIFAAAVCLFAQYDLAQQMVFDVATPVLNAAGKAEKRHAVTRIAWDAAMISMGVLLVYAAFAVIQGRRAKLTVARFFLASVIPLSAVYLLLMQPWNSPDAGMHFAAAYRYSSLLLGQGGEKEWLARGDDAVFFNQVWMTKLNPSTADMYAAAQSAHPLINGEASARLSIDAGRMRFYSPVNYAPQVVGLTAARLLRLGTVASIWLGRLCILAFYIVACRHAVKKTPVGKSVFAAVALLPMSLMMASSYSYDAMVLICTLNFLASAFSLRACPQRRRELAECCAWAFALGAVKGGGWLLMLPLTGMLFSREDRRGSMGKILWVFGAGIVSLVIFDLLLPGGETLFQMGGETGKLSAAYALIHPLRYFLMAAEAFVKNTDMWLVNMGGTQLAWAEPVIPGACVFGLAAAAALYSLYEKDRLTLAGRDRRLMLAVAALAFCLTPAMLLSNTSVGSSFILGVQGRYFLPVLPLLLLGADKVRAAGREY